MKQKSIKKNYIYNLIYQILLILTPFITTPYVSRILGAEGVGKVSFVESIVSYFCLVATMGISTYGQREISYVRDSVEKRSQVFWDTKVLEFITAGITLLVYVIFAVEQKDYILYLLFSFNILAVFFDVTWFFQGMEEFGKIVFRNVIFKLFNIIYLFVFVNKPGDVVVYIFGISFFSLLSNLSLWSYLFRCIGRIEISQIHPFKNMGQILSLFIPTIAVQVYTVLDKTMIGLITNSSVENGYYEQAVKIARVILTVVTALGTVMIPRIGYYFENGEKKEVEKLVYRGYRFVWFLGIPLCFGLIAVANLFVPWFFGNGFTKVTDLLRILAFLILAIGINNVTGMQYLIPTKRQNFFSITVIIGAVVNFVLNFFLIGIVKSLGAAIASVVAETVIAVVQLIIVRKELSILKILSEGKNYYISGGIMFVLLKWVNGMFKPTLLFTIIYVLIGVLVYTISLYVLRDAFFSENVSQIISEINKKIKKKRGMKDV